MPERRGFSVADKQAAIPCLQVINYYRLSAYFPPWQQIKDKFKQGTTFEQIIQTYSFDRDLRSLVFDCIERIEIAIRTQLVYSMAMRYNNTHWHDDQAYFILSYYNSIENKVDPFSDFQSIISKAKTAGSPEVYVKHYIDNYISPTNPPAWMCFELLNIVNFLLFIWA